MKKSAVLFLFALGSFSAAFAQNQSDGDFQELLKGSVKDANVLIEGYVGPAMRGIGSGLNQGWYNTAKPHKKFGVDLTLSTSLIYLPSSDELYLVDNTKLSEVKLVSYDGKQVPATGSASVPTIFGPDKSPTYSVDGTSFDGPGGVDLKDKIKIADALPLPMYQLGIGLPKGFDFKVRWSPRLKKGDAEFKLLGFGLMHDVGQYIPVVKTLPVDISLFAGYTRMSAEMDISGTVSGQNQIGEIEFNSTTIEALVSKKIAVLTIYGGVGYNMAKSHLITKGTYDLDEDSSTPDEKDPVNLDFSTSGMRATGGLRLKLAVFTLHGDYTLSKYNALNVGFGINVR